MRARLSLVQSVNAISSNLFPYLLLIIFPLLVL